MGRLSLSEKACLDYLKLEDYCAYAQVRFQIRDKKRDGNGKVCLTALYGGALDGVKKWMAAKMTKPSNNRKMRTEPMKAKAMRTKPMKVKAMRTKQKTKD